MGVIALFVGVILAVQDNLPHVRVVQAQDHLAKGGLAAAGLAHDGQYNRPVAVDGQCNVVHGHQLLAAEHTAHAEYLADAVYLK